jgi:hypothetical protein
VTDTIVPAGNTILDYPTELTVDEHGLVFVTDAGRNAVVVLDSNGSVLRQIGRAGSGPGEFQAPRSLTVAHDTLRLFDGGNGRVAVFTTAGSPVRSSTAPPMAMAGAVAFDALGAGVVSQNGRDSTLARRFDASGTGGSRLGQPVTAVPQVWHFSAIKQQIRDGVVPAELRNAVLPVVSSGGAVWLLFQAEGTAERYSPSDSLEWHIGFTEPEFASIRADFFLRNRADSAANRFYQLAYFTSGLVVGTDLWILLRSPAGAPTLLLVLGSDGRVRHRLRLPTAVGVGGFGLSPDRRVLYLLAYDDAAVLRARLPAGL